MANDSNDTVASLLNLDEQMKLSITIPLTEQTKKLRCRQFIKTDFTLPTLAKMTKLDKTYHIRELENYRQHIWNIHEIKIDVENEEMTLELYPYSYNLAQEMKNLAGMTKNETKETQVVKQNDEYLGNLRGDKYLQSVVKKIIGSKKTKTAQMKALYNAYNNKHVYAYYYDFQKTGKNFKKGWNTRALNCGSTVL